METKRDDILRQSDESEEEEPVRAKGESGGMVASPNLQNQLKTSKGGGSPLPERTNTFMSDAFGTDFRHVRVHNGAQANKMNQSIQAKAFTHGSDIYFRNGQYNPGNAMGKHLLAHELTHVMQQKAVRGKVSAKMKISNIQCKDADSFSPTTVNWSDTHDHILKEIATINTGDNQYFEVKIPGAIKGGLAAGRAGRADFYQASAPIALIFINGLPSFLKAHPDFHHKGIKSIKSQRAKGAPIAGPVGRGKNKCEKGHICRLDWCRKKYYWEI